MSAGQGQGDDRSPDDIAERSPIDWDRLLSQLASQAQEDGWVSLAEASSAAGVSLSTLRSWYRSGRLPSRMVPGTHGPQRLVPLEVVLDRALQSSRVRRQLEHARSLEAEVAELRQRVQAIERLLGLKDIPEV
ncbi:MAG TPA: excisionase [Actinomycetota bacterium]|nr:excisionase [Actinomycetota bacterium]